MAVHIGLDGCDPSHRHGCIHQVGLLQPVLSAWLCPRDFVVAPMLGSGADSTAPALALN
jgi:hypothetical protein